VLRTLAALELAITIDTGGSAHNEASDIDSVVQAARGNRV
jgi:hypothetical protein